MPQDLNASEIQIRRLAPGDDHDFEQMLDLFAQAFDDRATYSASRPGPAYRSALLARQDVVALVAVAAGQVVGALVAYQLVKFEQERAELYIYDLAVAERWRRRGIATRMLCEIKDIAQQMGAWVVYVQADYDDDPAVALYTKHGIREEVLHFDLPLKD